MCVCVCVIVCIYTEIYGCIYTLHTYVCVACRRQHYSPENFLLRARACHATRGSALRNGWWWAGSGGLDGAERGFNKSSACFSSAFVSTRRGVLDRGLVFLWQVKLALLLEARAGVALTQELVVYYYETSPMAPTTAQWGQAVSYNSLRSVA